ncbi:hypothetical protein BASA81_009072 [Batrachochytrium salamandrivorans]|nr:hypothetical protein BASA81_009072 [Batrachochytrium salamandrivorans]
MKIGKVLKGVITTSPPPVSAIGAVDTLSLVVEIERLGTSNLGEFGSQAFALFEHSFPNPDEREPVEDIVERIKRYELTGPDADGAEFHSHVFLNANRQVLAYSQGSIMPCGKDGLCYFWQYGCVADEDFTQKHYSIPVGARSQGLSKWMHWVNTETLRCRATTQGLKSLDLEVWETEQLGLGANELEVKYTATRLQIHTKSGARVLLGLKKDGRTFVNPYVQARLSPDSDPIVLHLLVRQNVSKEITMDTAKAIVLRGLVENFRREGFRKQDVDEVEVEMQNRFAECDKILLLSFHELPNAFQLAQTDKLFESQLIKLYNCNSLQEAELRYKSYH